MSEYAPWLLGHGEWVIGLAGIPGAYLLARVESIVSHRHDDGDDAA